MVSGTGYWQKLQFERPNACETKGPRTELRITPSSDRQLAIAAVCEASNHPQSGKFFRGEVLRRLKRDFFAGLRISSGNSDITRRSGGPSTGAPEPPSDLGLHTSLRSLGLRLKRDTSPNRFYPTAGTFLDFSADFFAQSL